MTVKFKRNFLYWAISRFSLKSENNEFDSTHSVFYSGETAIKIFGDL